MLADEQMTEEVCVAPPSEVYRKVGTQPAWRWGPVGSRLPSPGAKRWGGPNHLDNTAKTEVGVVEDPRDQVRAIECGEGRVDDGSGIGSGGRSDAAK